MVNRLKPMDTTLRIRLTVFNTFTLLTSLTLIILIAQFLDFFLDLFH